MDIPVLNVEEFRELSKLCNEKMRIFADLLTEPLRKALSDFKVSIPKHLIGRVAEFRQYACYAVPMAILKKAIERGDYLQGIDYPCPPMVLVVDKTAF